MSILPYEDEVIRALLHTYLWREFKASLAVRDIARDVVTRSWIVGRMPDETAFTVRVEVEKARRAFEEARVA